MKHHVIVICGSRDAQDINLLQMYVDTLHDLFGKLLKKLKPQQLIVIQGGQRGVDRLAGNLALEYGCGHVEVTALWDMYHQAAGPIRNAWMLSLRPDEVYAVHHDLDHSKGTLNCFTQAEALGIRAFRVPVHIPGPKPASNRSSNPNIRKGTRLQKS